MGIVGKILSPALGLLGVFNKPKALPAPVPLPMATPRANSVVADALSARRGAAANQRTGSGGAESKTAAKKTLLGT